MYTNNLSNVVLAHKTNYSLQHNDRPAVSHDNLNPCAVAARCEVIYASSNLLPGNMSVKLWKNGRRIRWAVGHF